MKMKSLVILLTLVSGLSSSPAFAAYGDKLFKKCISLDTRTPGIIALVLIDRAGGFSVKIKANQNIYNSTCVPTIKNAQISSLDCKGSWNNFVAAEVVLDSEDGVLNTLRVKVPGTVETAFLGCS